MFYIFNVLYFVHSYDCDKSVMTVIYYILTVSLRILTEMCRLMTVILPDATV